jgi:ankyrin repeat protein
LHCTNDSCTTNDENRNTPLIFAASKGQVEVMRVLLEGGANVDRTNVFQWTALHVAAIHGNPDVCRLLLNWGAKVNYVDKWKETPLHRAARAGYLSVVKLLVERGADVSLRNNFGNTASSLAWSWRRDHVVDWLDSLSGG